MARSSRWPTMPKPTVSARLRCRTWRPTRPAATASTKPGTSWRAAWRSAARPRQRSRKTRPVPLRSSADTSFRARSSPTWRTPAVAPAGRSSSPMPSPACWASTGSMPTASAVPVSTVAPISAWSRRRSASHSTTRKSAMPRATAWPARCASLASPISAESRGLGIANEKRRRKAPFPVAGRGGSERLEDSCRAHAGADAHGHHAVFLLATAQAVDDGGGADGAGGAERMAERDRAAKRVDLVRVQFRIAHDRQRLRGEGLVEFDPVQLVPGETCLPECLGDCGDRADAHHFRPYASHREADEAGEGREAVGLDRLRGSQQDGTGAIAQPRGVAGSHGATELPVAEHGPQLGQSLDRGVRTRPFVLLNE